MRERETAQRMLQQELEERESELNARESRLEKLGEEQRLQLLRLGEEFERVKQMLQGEL